MNWLVKFLKGDSYLLPAIDIGSFGVKVVQCERKKDSFKVKKHGGKEYKEQVFAGSELVDETELLRTLQELINELQIKDRQVIIHIPLHACFYSVISAPSSKKPEEAVSEYMQSIMGPEEIQNVKIDYRILPISIEKGSTDIAIAAVKRDVIEARVNLLKKINLEPVVIDIEPATINNQFYLNNPELTAIPVCLVDIGASFTKIIISFGGYPYVTRNIEIGGIYLTEQIQKELMLTFEDAENFKKMGELKEYSYEDIKPIISRFIRKITTETLWTIENFKDRFNLEVEKIFLYGGSSKIKDIENEFNALTGKECQKGSPLSFSGIPGHEEFAVAAGLSIRHKGDEDAKV